MRSVNVVFPESMCAEIPIFLILSKFNESRLGVPVFGFVHISRTDRSFCANPSLTMLNILTQYQTSGNEY